MTRFIDAHCHCHEMPMETFKRIANNNQFTIVCVSDDIPSSMKTVELSSSHSNIVPCIGVHPWSVNETSINDLKKLEELIKKYDVKCLGEIGLDTKFVPQTIEKQRVFFDYFIRLAREYDLVLNIHAAGTWSEVLDKLIANDIKHAYIHWYTGPKELIDKILELGYAIGANPAWKIQKKHRAIIEYAPIEIILTESDAPYKYRGLEMTPELVIETVEYLSHVKNISITEVANIIEKNFRRIFLF
ncbi:TatD family hydrolase [Desulfurococcaceae archaeon MEX13E-LK6-19]|nr:TatD family hydrolase [Desulfurococcaceae archaeon MEX13E-LK6-19]